MRFRVYMHSRPGIQKYYKGHVDVDAPTIHQAVFRAMDFEAEECRAR